MLDYVLWLSTMLILAIEPIQDPRPQTPRFGSRRKDLRTLTSLRLDHSDVTPQPSPHLSLSVDATEKQRNTYIIVTLLCPTMSSSKASIDKIPDDVIVSQLMVWLGPRKVLMTLGECSDHYHLLATSDELWHEFCQKRSTDSSEMVKFMKEKSVSDEEKSRGSHLIDSWYEAFARASVEPNALESYKTLTDGSFWTTTTMRLGGCSECNDGTPARSFCTYPSCTYQSCRQSTCVSTNNMTTCDCETCHVPLSRCANHMNHSLIHYCVSCRRRECLDCRRYISHNHTYRECWRCKITGYDNPRLCGDCAWCLSNNECKASLITTVQAYQRLPNNQVYCKTCATSISEYNAGEATKKITMVLGEGKK
jgi:hypothetical protein